MSQTKKETPNTLAQEIFKNKQLINERIEGMDFKEYQILRKIQSQVLKQLFRKAPNRRLLGCITPHKPLIQISRGFRRVSTQRKAS